MKLIIDIPYEAYYTFKCDLSKGNLNALAEIVAKGEPYIKPPKSEYEQALQTIWDRCQHCEETEKAFKVLRGDNK